jgi:hypothetical protein
MTNWMHSVLFVRGSQEDITRFRAENSSPTGDGDLAFAASVPMPEGVTDVREWCVVHWGVTSEPTGIVSYQQSNKIEYSFQTPKDIPYSWLQSVAAKYPTLEFQLDSMPEDLQIAYRVEHMNNPDRVVRTYSNLKISNMYHEIYRNIFDDFDPKWLTLEAAT